MAVLVRNGVVTLGVPTSPQQLLEQRAHGVYTSALLTPKLELVDWGFHKHRLVRNLDLSSQHGTSLDHYMQYIRSHNLSHAAFIDQQVQPLVKQAIGAFSDQAGRGGVSGMLAVCISPQDADAQESHLPVDLVILCKSVPTTPVGADNAVIVAIIGSPRNLAAVKHTQWIKDRQVWEAQKPSDVAEVLLSDQDGNILEGLVSNFFVVAKDKEGCMVLHVPNESQPVLTGVTQIRVLQAAKIIGLNVVHQAPSMHDRSSWQEAFITNCIKGLQPVKRVVCLESNCWGHAAWDCVLPHAEGPTTAALRHEVATLTELTPFNLL